MNFRRTLAALKPDLLTTYNWGSIEWAGINRFWRICRHIHFEAGFHQDEATRQLWRRVVARRLALANSEAVVVPSRTLERIAITNWRLPTAQVKFIPDGIEVSRFSGKRNSRPTGEIANVVIGTVAPLRPEKNLIRLIDAFSLISGDPRFHLVIAGDGPERHTLELFAAAKGLTGRVTFLGFVPYPEEILPSFDIFALSSDTEQIPNAVLEAMAARLPIASVDVGDLSEMVAELNRPFIVAADTGFRLADALRQLAENPQLRDQIGVENQNRVQAHYRQEAMFEAYKALLLTRSNST
jgi:glycosyltransferase involved in cell wall biosynthesis